MATIAEIIAAKKAAAIAGASAVSPPAGTEKKTVAGIDYARNSMNPEWVAQGPAVKPSETMAEKLDAQAAINRIDPPEKHQARKAASLILRAEQEPRTLSKTSGEGIDMTPAQADIETATWHAALNGFESDLVVMRDPVEAEVCWLAVRPLRTGLPPILLHRLPWTIWEHPTTIRPEDIPY